MILSGKKATISARTKNLWEQFVSKNPWFLSPLKEFKNTLDNATGNYLCLSRLGSSTPIDAKSLFHSARRKYNKDSADEGVR